MMKVRFFVFMSFIGLVLNGCLDSDVSSGAEQLKSDLAAIDAYLSTQGIVALKDINGIRFTVDSIGSGYPPRYDSKLTFNYTGKLLSGTVFQSGTLPDAAVSSLITGLQIGLPLIPNGSKATFYIPSVYAYGSEGKAGIPPNSNLIFEVFLKSIVITQTEKNQLGSDTARINKYLTTAGISNVVKDTSGLRYTITEPGTGLKPSWLNKVKVIYTGYIINDDGTKGSLFYSGTTQPDDNNDSRVVNYIRGFQIGLQQLPEASKAIFYIPSVLAFGTSQVPGGNAIVPANSSLLYEIELVEVLEP